MSTVLLVRRDAMFRASLGEARVQGIVVVVRVRGVYI